MTQDVTPRQKCKVLHIFNDGGYRQLDPPLVNVDKHEVGLQSVNMEREGMVCCLNFLLSTGMKNFCDKDFG